jgi:hypothetical protein
LFFGLLPEAYTPFDPLIDDASVHKIIIRHKEIWKIKVWKWLVTENSFVNIINSLQYSKINYKLIKIIKYI